MDALSHALLGFILGRALQLDVNLQIFLIVSSVCLDVDGVSIRSREAAFRSHRGPVHSVVAALLASLLMSVGYAVFIPLQAPVLLSVISVCLIGLLSHLLLDLLTAGNMTVLWPFSKRNFALNLTHFIDPITLGVLLMAALFIVYAKTDAGASGIVMAGAIAFLTGGFVARWYMKSASIKIIRRLDVGATSEIVPLPTLRPNRWLTVRKTPFENGYLYETYRVDAIQNRIMGKSTVESPYMCCSGPVEPPIDSLQKAVTRSKGNKSLSGSIAKFVLPAVDIISSNDGGVWQVFWYDAFTYACKGERQGILVKVSADGTVTVNARWTHITQR